MVPSVAHEVSGGRRAGGVLRATDGKPSKAVCRLGVDVYYTYVLESTRKPGAYYRFPRPPIIIPRIPRGGRGEVSS